MCRFFLRRLLHTIFSLLGTILIAFILTHLTPGDPLTLLTGTRVVDAELIETWRSRYGLDRPLLVQFGLYLRNLAQGDLGISYQYAGRSVATILLPAAVVTLRWQPISLALALGLAVPIGIVSAVKKDSWMDIVIRSILYAVSSVPEFVLAPLLIFSLAVKLHMLPVAGLSTPVHYILPSATLAIYPTALLARLLRTSMLEVLKKDYILSARAKGISEPAIIMRHAFRNAILPLVTVIGILVGHILSGAFIIENIFNIPGLGRVTVTAILQRDYPVILGAIVVLSATFLMTTFWVDIIYGLVDPRIRILEDS